MGRKIQKDTIGVPKSIAGVHMENHHQSAGSVTVPLPSSRDPSGINWSYFRIALLLAPSLIWIHRDHSVWPWDQAWYGQVCADLWFWLGHSPARWIATMGNGLDKKAPGISWFGKLFVPLGAVSGTIEAALLFSILLTQLGETELESRPPWLLGFRWLRPAGRRGGDAPYRRVSGSIRDCTR